MSLSLALVIVAFILIAVAVFWPKSKSATAIVEYQPPPQREPLKKEMDEKVRRLWNKHDPDMGMVLAWWRRIRAEKQNKMLEQFNAQERHLVEQASIISEGIIA